MCMYPQLSPWITGCPFWIVGAAPVAVKKIVTEPPLPVQRHFGGWSFPWQEIEPPSRPHFACPLLLFTDVIVSCGGAFQANWSIDPIPLVFQTESLYWLSPRGVSTVSYPIAAIGSDGAPAAPPSPPLGMPFPLPV